MLSVRRWHRGRICYEKLPYPQATHCKFVDFKSLKMRLPDCQPADRETAACKRTNGEGTTGEGTKGQDAERVSTHCSGTDFEMTHRLRLCHRCSYLHESLLKVSGCK